MCSASQTIARMANPSVRCKQPVLDDDGPPFYQPQGASHGGGTFAEVVCICNIPGKTCQCKDTAPTAPAAMEGKTPAELEPTLTAGCGMGH